MIIDDVRDNLQPVAAVPAATTLRAATVVFVAPVLLLGALAYHPYVPELTNDASVAAELTSDTTRWGLSHLAVGVAAALLLVALLAVADFLRAAGQATITTLAIPFIVLGSILFAFLPAMEIAMLAVHEAGGDVREVLPELNTWFVPVHIAGAAAFAIGMVGLAVAVTRSRVLDPGLTRFVALALVITAGTRFVPLGVALYVTGVVGIAALWPLAYRMRQGARPRTMVSSNRS